MNIQVENVVLPNKPLSNFEIEDAVKEIGLKNFRGVLLRDTLPKKPKRNECALMNLDDTSGDRTHWVAWFKCGDKKWSFDSFGLPPPTELNDYLSDVFYPTEQIQLREAVFLWTSLSFYFERHAKRRRVAGNNQHILVI